MSPVQNWMRLSRTGSWLGTGDQEEVWGGGVIPIVKSRKGSCMTSPQLGLSMCIKPSLVGIKPNLDATFGS